MKQDTFKILEFKGDRTKVLGKYAIPMGLEWAGGDIPLLMTKGTTIEMLQKLYPGLNFKDVILKTVKLTAV